MLAASHFNKELNIVELQWSIFCSDAFVQFQLILKSVYSTYPMMIRSVTRTLLLHPLGQILEPL